VDEHGPDSIHDAIHLMAEEFVQLYQGVKPLLKQKDRGRRQILAPID
jgi:hypothetical protein